MTTPRDTFDEQDLDVLDNYAERARQQDEVAELLEAVPSVVQRGGIYLIAGVVVISLALLWFGKAHAVVTATGQIVPEGESIPIQVLEGGVVAEVLVQAGDRVQPGDPILRIDPTRSGMSLAALDRQRSLQENQLEATRADSARIARAIADPMALARGPQPTFQLSNSQRLASALRIATLELIDVEQNGRRRSEQRQEQFRNDAQLSRQRLQLLEREREQQAELLDQARDDLAEFRSMAERGFFSEQDVRAEEQRFRQQEQRLASLDLDITNERLRVANLETQLDQESVQLARSLEQAQVAYRTSLNDLQVYLQTLRTDLGRLLVETANTTDEILLQRERVEKTSVLAPVAGTLVGLQVTTPGEVIGAGQVVGVLIPEGAPLIVKAQVPNKDIGFVTEDLPARVKVDAFPFEQFGTVPGRVSRVYPNAGGSANFTVLVDLLETSIRAGDRDVALFPGLTVEAELLTRKQRLIRLLLGSDDESASSS